MDADDLLARIRQDHPIEFELSRLSLLCEMQAAEIERLTALVPQSYTPFGAEGQEARHG
jgi:hypothetical protein